MVYYYNFLYTNQENQQQAIAIAVSTNIPQGLCNLNENKSNQTTIAPIDVFDDIDINSILFNQYIYNSCAQHFNLITVFVRHVLHVPLLLFPALLGISVPGPSWL